MLCIQYLQLENNEHPECYLRCTHLTGMRTKRVQLSCGNGEPAAQLNPSGIGARGQQRTASCFFNASVPLNQLREYSGENEQGWSCYGDQSKGNQNSFLGRV